MFWNSYVLKLLRLETLTFCDVMLSDINVVRCYVLSQYRLCMVKRRVRKRENLSRNLQLSFLSGDLIFLKISVNGGKHCKPEHLFGPCDDC
jgi:hypothetical protein